MKCLKCEQEILKKRNKMFCSIACSNVVNGKKPKASKHFKMICNTCGKEYTCKKSIVLKTKYCSKICLGASKRKENRVA